MRFFQVIAILKIWYAELVVQWHCSQSETCMPLLIFLTDKVVAYSDFQSSCRLSCTCYSAPQKSAFWSKNGWWWRRSEAWKSPEEEVSEANTMDLHAFSSPLWHNRDSPQIPDLSPFQLSKTLLMMDELRIERVFQSPGFQKAQNKCVRIEM